MDIYCPVCSEPWDMDTIHDEIKDRITIGDLAPLPDHDDYNTASPKYQEYRAVYDAYYTKVRNEFYAKGCNAMYAFSGGPNSWCKPDTSPGMTRGMAMSALASIMGDDLDGIASMMDDAEYMGMF